ncbi:MAG: glycosyltransferase family 4 protein [Longimicrobiales bacterium]
MRIALVVPGGVDRSGTQRVLPCVLWLIEELVREHDVHVFALRHEPEPARWELLGAAVTNIGTRPTTARTARAIVREHAACPFDLIHAIWAQAGVAAGLAGKLTRRPVLVHLTGGDLAAIPDIHYGMLLTRRGRFRLRAAVRGARRVLVPSEPTREAAQALGIDAVRVPLGVSTRAWPPQPPLRRDPSRPARLVHVASLNRVKDQTLLLRAARRLVEEGVPFHLDIVGEDTLAGAMQRIAAELGLTEHTTFHGFLAHDALRPVLCRSHVLIVSSRHETGPIVALEAAMTGVPTVGTAVGYIAEWAPAAAVAVPVGDAGALARAVAALLAGEDRRLAIAAAAQKRAAEEDVSTTARRILSMGAQSTTTL